MKINKLSVVLIISLLVFVACEDPKEEQDTTPPSITITSPQNGTIVSEVFNITCIATDNDAIDFVQLWVDGVSLGTTDNEEPYSLPCSTRSYEDDSNHTFSVRAIDQSENMTDSEPISLTIDNSNSWPDSVDVVSISYTQTEVTITWEQSVAEDFLEYRILTADAEDGVRTTIGSIMIIADTTIIHSEIIPDQQVWYWVEVIDQYGYGTTGKGDYIRVSSTLPDIVFVSNMGAEIPSLYRTDFDGNNLRQLTTGIIVQKLSVPYDGSIFIYEATIVGESGSHIFKMDPEGQNTVQLTTVGLNTNPIVSQDGSKIIFLSYRDQGSGEIYIMNMDGSEQNRLTNDEEYNAPYDISYNGLKVLFMSYESGDREIHIMDNDGSGDFQLTSVDWSEGYTYDPKFSPDATKFVYVHRGPGRLYTMNTDGTDQIQIWTQNMSPGGAQYSPNGAKILYEGNAELFLINVDGSGGSIQITDTEGEDLYPQFSSDGSYIAYESHIDNAYEILRTSSDGTETRQITDMGGKYPYFIPK